MLAYINNATDGVFQDKMFMLPRSYWYKLFSLTFIMELPKIKCWLSKGLFTTYTLWWKASFSCVILEPLFWHFYSPNTGGIIETASFKDMQPLAIPVNI